MKKARVRYNEKFDSFDIEIMTEDGWELSHRYVCQISVSRPYGSANYIHFGILREIASLQYMGYTIEIEL